MVQIFPVYFMNFLKVFTLLKDAYVIKILWFNAVITNLHKIKLSYK